MFDRSKKSTTLLYLFLIIVALIALTLLIINLLSPKESTDPNEFIDGEPVDIVEKDFNDGDEFEPL